MSLLCLEIPFIVFTHRYKAKQWLDAVEQGREELATNRFQAHLLRKAWVPEGRLLWGVAIEGIAWVLMVSERTINKDRRGGTIRLLASLALQRDHS